MSTIVLAQRIVDTEFAVVVADEACLQIIKFRPIVK